MYVFSRAEIEMKKLRRSVRVGDTVRVTGTGMKDKTLDVIVSEVYPRHGEYSAQGAKVMPLIKWEPTQQDRDIMSPYSKAPWCARDVSFVTEIISRAPYRTPKEVTNVYATGFRRDGHTNPVADWSIIIIKRHKYGAQPQSLARYILATHPYLVCPRGLRRHSVKFLWDAHDNPGFEGYYNFRNKSVSSMPNPNPASFEIPLINYAKFKRWFLRNLPKLLEPQSEIRRGAIVAAQIAEREYWADIADAEASDNETMYGEDEEPIEMED